MRTVYPIKTEKELERVRMYLRGKNPRDYLMFSLGVSGALRISDLLRLRFVDVYNPDGTPANYIRLNEQKTGKHKRFPITKVAEEALRYFMTYKEGTDLQAYLFTGRNNTGKPITRQRARTILSDAALSCGISEPFGSHGMRKTWGAMAWKRGVSLDMISIVLNHRSIAETRRYLGIEQEDIDDVFNRVNL